jgi:hypothetical protein
MHMWLIVNVKKTMNYKKKKQWLLTLTIKQLKKQWLLVLIQSYYYY